MIAPRARRAAYVGHIVIVMASLLAALAVAEGLLRWVSPQPLGMSYLAPSGLTLHIPNARIRYARQEFDHWVTMNSLGLRDREVAREKPPGTFRILVLGDSYAEGAQVPLEETFAKRLESSLSRRFPSRPWEVINGGVAGYGTAHELKFFHVYGRSFAPDLVIVAFAAGNDLHDNRHSPFFRWKGDRLEERNLRAPSRAELLEARLKELFASHSHLYQFLRDRYHAFRTEIRPERDQTLRVHRTAVLAPSASEDVQRDWRLTEDLLDRLSSSVAGAGARLLLVAVSMRLQVDDVEWETFARGRAELDRAAVQKRLASYASARGIPFLDLLPALQRAHRAERAYYRIDGHFNARGHAIAADEILGGLLSHRLISIDDQRSPK